MTTFLLVMFSIAWAVVAFFVLRALVIAWGFHRQVAVVTAFAAAAAFALGATSPFSVWKREQARTMPVAVAPAAAPRAGPHAIACPAGAKVEAGAGVGHIDEVIVGTKPAKAALPIDAPAGVPLRLRGWVVADAGPAQAVCVLVDGNPSPSAVQYGVGRPDVAAALAKPEDRDSGFAAELRLAPGAHTIALGAADAGAVHLLEQTISVRIR
jgi:hypothetical protein